MLTIRKLLICTRGILRVLCAIGLLSLPVLGAQQPKDAAPPAPVPTPIATAKKVFIANAPGDNLPASLGGPDRTYNEFYAAMKSWRRYELVANPAGADLIFEISFANPIVDVSVMSTAGGGSTSDRLLRLVIVDPKSHVPLWWFTESFAVKSGFSHRKETLDTNFDRSIAALVDDVRKLVGQSAVAADDVPGTSKIPKPDRPISLTRRTWSSISNADGTQIHIRDSRNQ
jgi:hypothetical protein